MAPQSRLQIMACLKGCFYSSVPSTVAHLRRLPDFDCIHVCTKPGSPRPEVLNPALVILMRDRNPCDRTLWAFQALCWALPGYVSHHSSC